MKPFGTWFGRLALAGGCLAWAGCGGGGVPDPDSDSNAASEASARPVDRGAAPAPAAEPPAPEAAAQAEPVAAARPQPPAAETEKPAPPAAVGSADVEKAAPPVKGDASGTEEMLRIAATPAPTPPPGETPAAATAPEDPEDRGWPAASPEVPEAEGPIAVSRREDCPIPPESRNSRPEVIPEPRGALRGFRTSRSHPAIPGALEDRVIPEGSPVQKATNLRAGPAFLASPAAQGCGEAQ